MLKKGGRFYHVIAVTQTYHTPKCLKILKIFLNDTYLLSGQGINRRKSAVYLVVNEHFETIYNVAMAENTYCAWIS